MKTGNYTVTYYKSKVDYRRGKPEMTETNQPKTYALMIAEVLTGSKEFEVIVVAGKTFTQKFEA